MGYLGTITIKRLQTCVCTHPRTGSHRFSNRLQSENSILRRPPLAPGSVGGNNLAKQKGVALPVDGLPLLLRGFAAAGGAVRGRGGRVVGRVQRGVGLKHPGKGRLREGRACWDGTRRALGRWGRDGRFGDGGGGWGVIFGG